MFIRENNQDDKYEKMTCYETYSKENLRECDGQSISSQCNVQKEGKIEIQPEVNW